jgi:hypothetical protein
VDAGVSQPGRRDNTRYRRALDLVCAQVDCASSRLYWYTDYDAARAAAAASGRPILVLRLLGRLDEELSCANSRFFRLVLYSDPAIAGWLREHAVLYWSSERPVPKVTIDYGDGRRLVGTVTGNSIHYLLDSRGRLVDALPGLYAPHRFLAWLREEAALAGSWASLDDASFAARSREEHGRRQQAVVDELVAQLVKYGWEKNAARAAWGEQPTPPAGPLSAAEVARLALSKSRVEAPMLTAFGLPPEPPTASRAIDELTLTSEWQAELSPESRQLVAARAPAAVRAELGPALLRLEQRLGEDSLRNEAFLHRRLHVELSQADATPRWQDFNVWVYSDLFLTPASDPWLRLGPTEALSALDVPPSVEGGRP